MIPSLILKSGNKIPRLGLGTWTIGGGMTRDPNNDDQGQIESIRYALDQGITFIRTAQNYAEGHCEELVGEAINSVDRSKVYLISAVNEKNIQKLEDFETQIHGSLKRLKTNYLDMYLLGGIDPNVSLKIIATGLLRIKKLGLAKDVGVGNYRVPELRQLQEYLGNELAYNEVHANLIIREPFINGVYEYCRENQIVMGAYRPLQLGLLSRPGTKLLDDLAVKYSKSQSVIALKWLISKPNTVTMPKSTNQNHMDEVVDLFNWDIEQSDLNLLTNNFPNQSNVSNCISPVANFRR